MVDERQEAVVWQQYLNDRFPDGVQLNYVDSDGSLRFPSRMLPALVVMDVKSSGWPVLLGFDYLQQMSYDVTLFPVSWKEMDRHGHFVARLSQENGPTIELSSWIPDAMAVEMSDARSQSLVELTESSRVLEGTELGSPAEAGMVPSAIRASV